MSDRGWTRWLVVLALVFPLGALAQPWLFPSRSALPKIQGKQHTPVVLITVPGLRADRLSHLGYPRRTTPNLDRVARHGVSFTRAYAASNDPQASLAALHTGRFPAATGVLSAGTALPRRLPTLAQRLAQFGYHTMAVRADPRQTGMDLERSYQQVIELPAGADANELVDHALALVDQAALTPHPNYLLWIDFPDLIAPYGSPGANLRRWGRDMPEGFGDDLDGSVLLTHAELARRGWGEREQHWISDRYDGALYYLDRAIGRLLDGLEQRWGLHSSTICITGTSGERLDDRPTLATARSVDLYEHSVHVPLLFQMPTKLARGRRVDWFVGTVDIAPTLLELAFKQGPRSELPGACGHSLFKTMLNNRRVNRVACSQGAHRVRDDGTLILVPQAVSLRAGNFKYISSLRGPANRELYDLSTDPTQAINGAELAGGLVNDLRAMVWEWRQACPP